MCDLQLFSPILCVVFYFLTMFFTQKLILIKSNSAVFSFVAYPLGSEIICQIHGDEDLRLCFLRIL